MKRLIFVIVALAFPTIAPAQELNCTFSGNTAHCYDPSAGYRQGAAAIDDMFDSIADQMQRQALINSYRQAHGMPKCSAFPLFHWDGLPGC